MWYGRRTSNSICTGRWRAPPIGRSGKACYRTAYSMGISDEKWSRAGGRLSLHPRPTEWVSCQRTENFWRRPCSKKHSTRSLSKSTAMTSQNPAVAEQGEKASGERWGLPSACAETPHGAPVLPPCYGRENITVSRPPFEG